MTDPLLTKLARVKLRVAALEAELAWRETFEGRAGYRRVLPRLVAAEQELRACKDAVAEAQVGVLPRQSAW